MLKRRDFFLFINRLPSFDCSLLLSLAVDYILFRIVPETLKHLNAEVVSPGYVAPIYSSHYSCLTLSSGVSPGGGPTYIAEEF